MKINNMNNFEKFILERVATKYSVIKHHIPYIRVRERVCTGVGMYVNFDYTKEIKEEILIDPRNDALSTNENIKIDCLNFGLGFELVVTDGKIDFIELITYGEEWNGNTYGYRL